MGAPGIAKDGAGVMPQSSIKSFGSKTSNADLVTQLSGKVNTQMSFGEEPSKVPSSKKKQVMFDTIVENEPSPAKTS